MFGWGMLAALLTFGLALAGCDNPTGGTDSSYKPTYELEGGGTLTITGGEGETAPKTDDTFELVIGGKKTTGKIEVDANGTITFIPQNGGDPFTANPGSEGAITIDGGSIRADDGATVEVPSGEVAPSAPGGGGQTNAELLVGTWYSENNTPATFTNDGKYLNQYGNGTYTATETTFIVDTGEVFSFTYTIKQNGNTLTLTFWDDILSQTVTRNL
jgi:hypothetical protein